jgi:hypothetical protein
MAMSGVEIFLGNNKIHAQEAEVLGQFMNFEGDEFYQIKNYDSMLPFFMSLVSDSDHWMFISSTGGLTAGRKNPDNALFPYYTDDKIQESVEISGSKTILHVSVNGKKMLWEPFSTRYNGLYAIERNIYKNTTGNKLMFEEKNIELGLTFKYGWMNANDFGWIKKSWLTNDTNQPIDVTIVDGLQNILPSGVERMMQNQFSTLLDAYKKCELLKKSGLGLFRLESIPVDRAEPSEALKISTVWSCGLTNPTYLLSSRQLDNFRKGLPLSEEVEAKGIKGGFYVSSNISLAKNSTQTWYFIAELNQDIVKVNNLIDFIAKTNNIQSKLDENIASGVTALRAIVAEADGIQQSADKITVSRHFSNVLFNVMRGGIFSDGYTIDCADFKKHLQNFNHTLVEKHKAFLNNLPAQIEYTDLNTIITNQKDSDLTRLFFEYLPLTFSRRHGDPSRPWNLFSINIKDANGNKLLYYQGNWRDIFQNWEALSLSYPEYINGIITKFVNATTADGYNPYRVTRDGFEWEIPEPDNPWSSIGYWGDHQIIYLLKLLEVSRKHFPDRLQSWLNSPIFAYANVPYRIKPYTEILSNPQDSIVLDTKLNHSIEELVKTYGADAKLVLTPNGEVFKVSFTEKLLSPLLSKLSNFIPEAGIWMNTLRPEWNDANNALVGYGVSMVTLYYIRRYLSFIEELYNASNTEGFTITEEMAGFLQNINNTFIKNQNLLEKGFDIHQRKQTTDQLGMAGTDFRTKVYGGFSGKSISVSKKALVDFIQLAIRYMDQSIKANKRADKMYNAYNLISIKSDSMSIRYLYEMLEGQVAVLSSGKLSPDETVEVLDSMRNSLLYRADQESYVLYPNKKLPLFLEKNIIPENEVNQSPILKKLIEMGNLNILSKDVLGQYHFNGEFSNASFLSKELTKLKNSGVISFSDLEFKAVLDIYEKIFDHQSFTGRSGTFYKYEGLGCIYWHMVSKLLLVIGENYTKAVNTGASKEIVDKLARHYAHVQHGIGAHKSPKDYGSFPFDPYSHTPQMAGVQQPGMTGQVKEDIISRFFELGVMVHDGQISIQPRILRKSEFIAADNQYKSSYLSFTYCKVPFVFLLDNNVGIELIGASGKTEKSDSYTINAENSLSIMNRDGEIAKVLVHFKANSMLE